MERRNNNNTSVFPRIKFTKHPTPEIIGQASWAFTDVQIIWSRWERIVCYVEVEQTGKYKVKLTVIVHVKVEGKICYVWMGYRRMKKMWSVKKCFFCVRLI